MKRLLLLITILSLLAIPFSPVNASCRTQKSPDSIPYNTIDGYTAGYTDIMLIFYLDSATFGGKFVAGDTCSDDYVELTTATQTFYSSTAYIQNTKCFVLYLNTSGYTGSVTMTFHRAWHEDTPFYNYAARKDDFTITVTIPAWSGTSTQFL
jgi:hypothetical protein